MKSYFLILIFLFFFSLNGQINLIQTGTSSVLNIPSIIGKNTLVGGNINYLSKSYDDCDNLIPLNIPGTFGNTNFYQRLDTNLLFSFSADFNFYDFKIFKSHNDGQSWVKIFDSIGGVFFARFAFFDSTEGMAIGTNGKMTRTKNGGSTWLNESQPLNSVTAIKTYGDSMICVGGINSEVGVFFLSKDRGNTWLNGGNFAAFIGSPRLSTDFFFLSKDTIFAIAASGGIGSPFAKTFDGGQNWEQSIIAPGYATLNGLCAKSKNEVYAVGVTSGTIGIIFKTTDLGQTWSSFNTGIKTELTDMAFLNDSIALVAGSNGVLFKWNSKTAVFTGIKENHFEELSVKISPNPTKDKFVLHFESILRIEKLTIVNTLGQELYFLNAPKNNQEIDVGFLEAGMYYLRFEGLKSKKIYKLVKE